MILFIEIILKTFCCQLSEERCVQVHMIFVYSSYCRLCVVLPSNILLLSIKFIVGVVLLLLLLSFKRKVMISFSLSLFFMDDLHNAFVVAVHMKRKGRFYFSLALFHCLVTKNCGKPNWRKWKKIDGGRCWVTTYRQKDAFVE
jgi:hypothetical protein